LVGLPVILLVIITLQVDAETPNLEPVNPFLAQSVNPIGHGGPAQQDATDRPGPTGPTRVLRTEDIKYIPIGPAHFGGYISSSYKNGRRVIWSNGGSSIVKLDYESLEVLSSYQLAGKKVWTNEEAEKAIATLESLEQPQRIGFAAKLAMAALKGLSGVYALLDVDGNFFVAGHREIIVYGDAVQGDPDSEIVIKDTWELPEEVSGSLVGINMTYDGWLIAVTNHGYVIAVSRELRNHHSVKIRHSKTAKEYSEKIHKIRNGYGWVRNSIAIDDNGGIYIVSKDHIHKVVWTGEKLSKDNEDGAWAEPYLNGWEFGSGSTPSLMGFGDENKFVVITDGEVLMNMVLYWRDDIPEDWKQLQGAPSRRIAGMLPVNMGDPKRTAIQSEQSVVVGGYGALLVNNKPASFPENFPVQSHGLLVGYLGSDPDFTPHGLQKFEWDPETRILKEAWANTRVSSPNCVPHLSSASNIVYTVGVRDGKWALEGLDWKNGRSVFHWVVGGERYNSLFSQVHLDQEGRIIYGTSFGKVRLMP
jgi:hypothetical protein